MNLQLLHEIREKTLENYTDVEDGFKKKSGYNMDKLTTILDSKNITIEEFIEFAKNNPVEN